MPTIVSLSSTILKLSWVKQSDRPIAAAATLAHGVDNRDSYHNRNAVGIVNEKNLRRQ